MKNARCAKPRFNPVRIIAVPFLLFLIVSCASTEETARVPGVLEGKYTVEQARRGSDAFGEICRKCHIPRDFRTILSQSNDTVAIVNDYYELIRLTMPQDSPGSLSEEVYQDIMAYLMSLNGVPPASD